MERNLKRSRAAEDEGGASVDLKPTPESSDSLRDRKTIRSHYREIEIRINEGKDEIASGDSERFLSIMNDVEEMHQHVVKPREQVADAEALLGLTRTLVASVKTHARGGITPAQFVSCLINRFGKQKGRNYPIFMWKDVGLVISPIFMNTVGCKTMVGPMKNDVKQHAPDIHNCQSRLRSKPRPILEKAKPKEFHKDVEAVTDTDKNILTMFEKLKKEKKAKLENLILNKSSFAQTVENLFAFSFLVKDGRVRIDVDDNDSQVVVPSNGPSAQEIKSGEAKNYQFIFRFDFNDWKLMQSLEGEELMPSRMPAEFDAPLWGAKTGCPGQLRTTSDETKPLHLAKVKKFTRNYGHTMQA